MQPFRATHVQSFLKLLFWIVLLAAAEIFVRQSHDLFQHTEKIRANVINAEIKQVPVPMSRSIREITLVVVYKFAGRDYISEISERLTSTSYDHLEDSDTYQDIVTAMQSRTNIDIAINPQLPSKPKLFPKLTKVRIWIFLLVALVGFFAFSFLFGREEKVSN